MSIQYQDDETRDAYKANWRSLLWVLVLTGLVRCVFLCGSYRNLNADPDAYRKLAGNLLETGVYGWKSEPVDNTHSITQPTAFRPPLYPILLLVIGGANANWPIASLHLVLGVATAGLVTATGDRAGLGRWSLVAGLLAALDPILLNQSTLVMTETLATFLAALAMFSLTVSQQSPSWKKSAVTGCILGLCTLCRPTFLPWLGLIALTELSPWYRNRKSVRQATLFVLAALLVMAPWVIRNQMVLGRAKLTTTHGGYTVLLGNNPLFYRYLNSASAGTWDGEQLSRAWKGRQLTSGPHDDRWKEPAELAREAASQTAEAVTSELEDDRFAYALARRYISEQPRMFIYASAIRIARLWQVLPHRVGETESTARSTFRYLVGGWYLVLFALGVYGLLKLGRGMLAAPWLFGLQMCLVFTAVHTLYWSNMRMRAPLMPLVCLAAASGLAAIGQRIRSRKA